MRTLKTTQAQGGVDLPDPTLFCTAVQECRHSSHKLLVSLEQESVPVPLASLPWTGVRYSWLLSIHPLIEPTFWFNQGYIWWTRLLASPDTDYWTLFWVSLIEPFSCSQIGAWLEFLPYLVLQDGSVHSTPLIWAGGKFCNCLISSGPFQTIPVSADLLHLKIFVWEMSPYWNLSPSLMVSYLQLHPSTTLHVYANGKETLTLHSQRIRRTRYSCLLTSLPFAVNTRRLHLKSWRAGIIPCQY